MLNFLIGILVIIHLWILWDIISSGWENVDIDITAEELESDLFDGLHLYGRDE